MQHRLNRSTHPGVNVLRRLEMTGGPLQPLPVALYRRLLGVTRQPMRSRGAGRPAGRRARARRTCTRARRSGASRGDPEGESEPGEPASDHHLDRRPLKDAE